VTFYDQLLPRLRALPGVAAASTVFPLPLSGSGMTFIFNIEERPKPKAEQPNCPMRIAAADYFRTMGIPVRRGRGFDARDQFKSKPVVIVNEKFAEEYFPGEEVIGKRIQPGLSVGPGDGPMCEIVGVVANVKHQSLRSAFTSEVYLPATQS
jgi:putative ABC transport system permease protein